MDARIKYGIARRFQVDGPAVLITDSHLAQLYGDALAKRLNCELITIPEKEEGKTRKVKSEVENRLIELGAGSDVTLVAFGGGAVTDLVGFVAATYCRGVKLILIPTTLLAMCDAAIGGKNGINVGFKKNALGTLYQPDRLLIDPEILKTLPDDEWRSGAAEMLKHGLIRDERLWNYLCDNLNLWTQRNPHFLHTCIEWNIRIKTQVIAANQRHLLNFGHTVGHAIEMLTKLRHGDAIAKGMWIETLWSLGADSAICEGLKSYGFNLDWPNLDLQQVWKIMQQDKKNANNKVYAAQLLKIGCVSPSLKEITFDDITSCLSCAS